MQIKSLNITCLRAALNSLPFAAICIWIILPSGQKFQTPKKPKKKVLRKFVKRTWKCLSPSKEDKGKWIKKIRANLGLMATIITTMSFQIILNLPGGVISIRDDGNSSKYGSYFKKINNILLCPGQAIINAGYTDIYFAFLVSNTLCFLASLSVCLLLVSRSH
jgi:hypothetical protein